MKSSGRSVKAQTVEQSTEPKGAMSLPVGVCLGDGTVILLRAQPTSARPAENLPSSSMAPIVVYDTALLTEALESFQATGVGSH